MNYLFFVDLFCLVFVSVLFSFVLYFVKYFPDWPFLRNKTEIWVSRFFLRCSHTWPLCSTSSTPSCLPSDGNLSRCLVLMWSAPELDSQMKTKKTLKNSDDRDFIFGFLFLLEEKDKDQEWNGSPQQRGKHRQETSWPQQEVHILLTRITLFCRQGNILWSEPR